MIFTLITIVGVCAVITYLGVEIFRRWSLQKNWLDIPNDRSSHNEPTPRGGGLVIVIVSLTAYCMISVVFPSWFSWGYFVGAVVVAGISWLDDLRSISFGWRLLVHFLAAGLVVYSSGYWRSIGFSSENAIELGAFGPVITIFWIVWVINAYNFMDGIDGIAGVQALVTAIAWAVAAGSLNIVPVLLFGVVLAGSSFGFLIQNWSPARVFLGDVGSAFIGFTFGAMPLFFTKQSAPTDLIPLAAILFLWPFIFDSVFTLVRRLMRVERIWVAHRSHLYQLMVTAGYPHHSVSKLYGFFAAASAVIGMDLLLYPGQYTNLLVLILISVSLVFAGSVVLVLGTNRANANLS